MFPSVYILVLNWNSWQNTSECILGLKQLTYSNYKVVIIDNGSSDDSETVLKKKFPEYAFIQTGGNLGYAGGNNRGICYALDAGADFIWILNPDVRVEADSLEILVDAMIHNPSIGICGPKMLEGVPPDVKQVEALYLYPEAGYTVASQTLEEKAEVVPFTALVPTDYVGGCSMLIRRKVFEQIGLIREDFFLYYEETDFNWRAKKHGWKLVVCRRAANSRKPSYFNMSKERHYYIQRNRILFARLQHKYVLTTLIRVLSLKWVFESLKKNQYKEAWQHFQIICRAVFVGLTQPFNPIPRYEQLSAQMHAPADSVRP